MQNTVVRVARLPQSGPLEASVFDYVDEPLTKLDPGSFLIESFYMAVDAGSRAMLDKCSDYVLKLWPGDKVPTTGIVGRIVESRHPDWRQGDFVRLMPGYRQKYIKIDPEKDFVHKIDQQVAPISAYVGLLGLTGFTAWLGVTMADPKVGETVLVSAAAGAVGTAACQFARAQGARVVGVAGGREKCVILKDELGLDECIDYKSGNIAFDINHYCPEGVDVYFENVGGEVQRAAFAAMNDFGRIVMCGQVSQYDGTGAPAGPNLMTVVLKRLIIRGFLAFDHYERFPEFTEAATRLYAQGKLRHKASVVGGFGNLHEAINSLMRGGNIGQQVHQVNSDSTVWQ